MIEQAKFIYSPLRKAFEKQKKKQAGALCSINLSNKIDESNQIKSIIPVNQMNDLILDRLEEMRHLQNCFKINGLDYKSKNEKNNYFSICHCLLCS